MSGVILFLSGLTFGLLAACEWEWAALVSGGNLALILWDVTVECIRTRRLTLEAQEAERRASVPR